MFFAAELVPRKTNYVNPVIRFHRDDTTRNLAIWLNVGRSYAAAYHEHQTNKLSRNGSARTENSMPYGFCRVLRSLWGNTRGSSSLLDRTTTLYLC